MPGRLRTTKTKLDPALIPAEHQTQSLPRKMSYHLEKQPVYVPSGMIKTISATAPENHSTPAYSAVFCD